MAENYFWCEDSRRVRCHHERLGCTHMLLFEGVVLLLFQLLFQICVTAYEHMSMSTLHYNVCVYMCVSMREFRVYWQWTGTLKKKNKSTQTSALPSVQGAILKQKESFGGRKEMDRKKKQILKCALKKSRLKASFFSPFFLASFLAAIERSRMIVGCSCKWRG